MANRDAVRFEAALTESLSLPYGRGANRAEAICDLPPAFSDGKASWLFLCDAPGADRKQGEDAVFGDLMRYDRDRLSLSVLTAPRLLALGPPRVTAPVRHQCGSVCRVDTSLGLYLDLPEDREAYKARFGRSRWVVAQPRSCCARSASGDDPADAAAGDGCLR